MKKRPQLKKMSLAIALCIGTAPVAFAQTADKTDQEAKKDAPQRVVITGSNIKRVDVETASPVQIISKEELTRSGATSLTDALKTISSNMGGVNENAVGYTTTGASSMNLRGIGSQATLVLLNGRRVAPHGIPDGSTGFVDLNSIPMAAVERVEILKDGASAIYGSDAMAGVVNIILRNNYQGIDLSAGYGSSERHDGEQARASISFGAGSLVEDKWNAYATFDVRSFKPTFINKRDDYLSTQDLRAWGYKDGRTMYTFPGNLYWTDAATGKRVARPIGGNCPVDKLVPAEQLLGNTATGQICANDDFKDTRYNSGVKSDRTSFTGKATYLISENAEIFAEAMFSQNKARGEGMPHYFFGYLGNATPDLPITHPQYPKDLIDPVTGKTLAGGNKTVRVAARLTDFPGMGFENQASFNRLLGGIKGNYKSWDWESGLLFSSSKVDSILTNGLLRQPLLDAYLSGEFLFGQSANNGQFSSKISRNAVQYYKSNLYLWDAKISGELTQLPAGPLNIALGVEAKRESVTSAPDQALIDDLFYNWSPSAPGYTRNRKSASTYAELTVPVMKSLEANAAVRFDHYDDYGNSTTPKLGFKWNALPNFLVRGTYAQGFRAPSLRENSNDLSKYYTTFDDLARCNDKFRDGCRWQIQYSTGGNPDLKPEKSKSFTLGLVWEASKSLDFSLDFWQITRKDEIKTLDLATVIQNPERYAGNSAISIIRKPLTAADAAAGATAGEITGLTLLLANIAETRVRGVDFNINHRYNAGEFGKFTNTAQVTYNHSYVSTPAPGAEAIDYAGSRYTPRVFANIGSSWKKGAWNISADINYVGHQSPKDYAAQECKFVAQGFPALCGDIASFTTIDFGVKYSGLWKNLVLNAAVRNAFDRKPPFAPDPVSQYQVAAITSLHSTMGRYFYISADYKFK